MGTDAYRVEYHSTNIPRNYEFHDLIQDKIADPNENENTYHITEELLDEFIEEHPELLEKFKEELEILRKELLSTEDKTLTLSFS